MQVVLRSEILRMNTKKQLTFLLCCLSLIGTASAQRLQFGATGSMDFFSVKGDGISPSFKPGYNAGVYFQWKINRQWKIRPELLFTQKNLETSADFKEVFPQTALSNVQSSVLLNAITVPLLISHSIGRNWSLLAGPEYMYAIDSDENLMSDGKMAFKEHSLSVVGGVQWQWTSALCMQGRYTYGLTNLSAMSDKHPWKSRSLSLGISWRIL